MKKEITVLENWKKLINVTLIAYLVYQSKNKKLSVTASGKMKEVYRILCKIYQGNSNNFFGVLSAMKWEDDKI